LIVKQITSKNKHTIVIIIYRQLAYDAMHSEPKILLVFCIDMIYFPLY